MLLFTQTFLVTGNKSIPEAEEQISILPEKTDLNEIKEKERNFPHPLTWQQTILETYG